MGQRRLIQRQLADSRERPGRFDRDDSPGAQPEDLMRLSAVKQRAEVFDLFTQAMTGTVGAAYAAAAPVGYIDGELVAESLAAAWSGRGRSRRAPRTIPRAAARALRAPRVPGEIGFGAGGSRRPRAPPAPAARRCRVG